MNYFQMCIVFLLHILGAEGFLPDKNLHSKQDFYCIYSLYLIGNLLTGLSGIA